MRVLALAPSPINTSPGQRFRIEQWAPLLRERGVEIVYSMFTTEALGKLLYQPGHQLRKLALMAQAYARQLGAVSRAHGFDLIYVFREATLVGPALIETLIAGQRIPIVFDFDDAVFVPYKSPSNGYLSYFKFFGKTARLCRHATQIIAGNDYLREYALKYNSQVSIIPTTIDTDAYRPELCRPRSGGKPVIGWTGSYSTLQHLESAVPALEKLSQRHAFRLVVIGAEPPRISGVEVEARPWRAETEVADLADIEIGIMPLPDDPWTRGKCGLKALQYMALGIPPVVSVVGVNGEIVEDGVNGFLAESDDDWVERLSLLIEKPSLRRQLGEAARQTVEERYSARVIAPRVYELFRKAASTRG